MFASRGKSTRKRKRVKGLFESRDIPFRRSGGPIPVLIALQVLKKGIEGQSAEIDLEIEDNLMANGILPGKLFEFDGKDEQEPIQRTKIGTICLIPI
jgi:hypothetical protein